MLYGEELPEFLMEKFQQFPKQFSECDCLIVMGTNLKVFPFPELVDLVDCPRLLINRDLVGNWANYKDDPDSNYRDVAYLGDCDDGCTKLAELLGWTEDLDKLMVDVQKPSSSK